MTLDPQTIGLIAFSFMMLLIVIGVPIAFSMLGTAALGLFIVGGPIHAETQISLTFIEQGANFVIVAIPLYFLMGQLVFRTEIAADLYDCVYKWLGRLPGGLAITSVVACAGFGAVSGGSVTAVATMGPMCMPAMRRYGYDDGLAAGSISSAGIAGTSLQSHWPKSDNHILVKTRVLGTPPRERMKSLALCINGSSAEYPATFNAR